MITRLEIDGFKSFSGFDLTFAPFQVIIGPNGAGKSNLFDALRLLSKLTEEDLRSAFQDLRGEAGELFGITDSGAPANSMRFAVEMMVARKVRDSWGTEVNLKHTRLRYELEIKRRSDEKGLERPYVTFEELEPIKRSDDEWIKYYGISHENWLPKLSRGRSTPFISTQKESGKDTVYLHQDGRAGRRLSVAEQVERTVLNSVVNTEFPHAFAAREEMRQWRLLQLNPEVLRQPSPMLASEFIAPDGKNLPNALARLKAEDPYLLNDISRDLANLVPGISHVGINKDETKDQYVIWAKTQDDCKFSSRVLSDGTLRALALVTLKNDPSHHGVLLFEEPENGIHAARLKSLVSLLTDMTTDFSDADQVEDPLRQLLINTHSPVLVKHLVEQTMHRPNGNAKRKACRPKLVFARMATRPDPKRKMSRVTRIIPVESEDGSTFEHELGLDDERAREAYSLAQIIQYLNTANTASTVGDLKKERPAP